MGLLDMFLCLPVICEVLIFCDVFSRYHVYQEQFKSELSCRLLRKAMEGTCAVFRQLFVMHKIMGDHQI